MVHFDAEAALTKARPTWGRGIEFLMSCISSSVGLGNIWRFPYVCFKNGGGTFLIPYLIVLFFIAKPFYFLEMILGQFTSKGSMKAVEAVPILKGVGWGQQIASATVATYYSAIIGLTLFYAFKSFDTHLPWSTCEEFGDNCFPAEALGQVANNSEGARSSAELFFNIKVLNKIDDISHGLGPLVPGLVVCLFIAWVVIYFSVIKGIRTSGKLAYLFAILPYFILTIILIRSITLPGALNGVKYFFLPEGNNWVKLLDVDVWYQATTQCFFSMTIGMGCVIMFSSYNEFDRNIYRDVHIVSMMDTFASLLGGVTIFAILGNLANNLQKNINEVVTDAMSLAFVTYPEAISKISKSLADAGYWPQAMAIFFFIMLFTLGIGSNVGVLNNLATNIKDYFPSCKYWQIALAGAFYGFLLGLFFVTRGGFHIVGFVDNIGAQFLIFVMAIGEVVGIFWIYGLENLCWDVEFMLKRKLSAFWRISWFIVMPAFLIFVLLFWIVIIIQEPMTYGPDSARLPYPTEVSSLVWSIFIIGVLQVFVAMAYIAYQRRNVFGSTWTYLTSPNPEWGPSNPATKADWAVFKADKWKQREEIVTSRKQTWLQQKYWLLMGKYP